MKTFNIYKEGYLDQGMEGRPASAELIGIGEGNTFGEAVLDWVCRHTADAAQEDFSISVEKRWLPYDEVTNPVAFYCWGCKLYPTLEEAQESFG